MNWEWIIKLALGAAAVLGYYRVFKPVWSSAVLVFYDVPVLLLGGCVSAATISRLWQGHTAQSGIHLAALFGAGAIACGSGFRDWPISGHLTFAVTAGLLVASDRDNPPWYRVAALIPAAVLILLRTYWPQSSLMSNRLNTLTACLAGAALAAVALALAARAT